MAFDRTYTRHDYADGTYTVQGLPWGVYLAGAALCSDGKVRKLKRIAQTADTFFSVPASVRVKGKTVAGFITVETKAGFTHPTEDDPSIVKFIAYGYRKNANLLPRKPL